jgi:hypothetical protein
MALWLRNTERCHVVIAELATLNSETPDVLGFYRSGMSVLIEVKVSRGDFAADKDKHFRAIPKAGVGDRRYFAAPKGMLRETDLPPFWGLLELDGERQVLRTKEAEAQDGNKRVEVSILTSAMRRLELSTAVFIRSESADSESDQLSFSHD